MKGELYINEKDAYTAWGVGMGSGFLSALDSFPPMKSYVENDSRLEHGRRVITDNARVDSRDVTLEFTIMGTGESDYRTKRKAFQQELQKGAVDIRVPALGNEVYHLVYTGKSASYALSLSRRFGRLSAKFTEPNPTDRT